MQHHAHQIMLYSCLSLLLKDFIPNSQVRF